MPEPTAAHWALAAEAVTGGPTMLERDITARVAQALADAEQRGADAVEVWYCPDCAEPGDSPHLDGCAQSAEAAASR